jgi:hypothetical protein
MQKVEALGQLRGQTLTFAVTIKSTVASRVRVFFEDNLAVYAYSAYNTGTGAERLTVTTTFPAAATTLLVGVHVDTGTCTVEVNDAVLVVGPSAPPFQPLHSADDFDRCVRYYEVIGSGTTGEIFGVGHAIAATTVNLPIRYATKAVLPAVSVSLAADFGAYVAGGGAINAFASIAPLSIGLNQCYLNGQGSSGLVAGNAALVGATNANARVTIQANP